MLVEFLATGEKMNICYQSTEQMNNLSTRLVEWKISKTESTLSNHSKYVQMNTYLKS